MRDNSSGLNCQVYLKRKINGFTYCFAAVVGDVTGRVAIMVVSWGYIKSFCQSKMNYGSVLTFVCIILYRRI